MKHPFAYNQFIAMITSHQISKCLGEISTGKTELVIRQRGGRERLSSGLRERGRESIG